MTNTTSSLDDNFTDFSGVSPDNLEPKCLWVLVLDTSYSMADNIHELEDSLRRLKDTIERDPVASERMELSIIEFNNNVHVRCAPKLIGDIDVPQLTCEGSTYLVEAVERAMQVVDVRLNWYQQTNQSFYQPFIILITDGEPNGPGSISQLSKTIHTRMTAADRKSRFVFIPFGVKDADMALLEQISFPEYPPLYVENADFARFFKWISNSVKVTSSSSPVDQNLPAAIYQGAQDDFQYEC